MVHRTLTAYHNKLAREVVEKWASSGIPYEDMFQEALFGIWQSLQRANAKGEYPSTLYMKLRGQDRVKRLVHKHVKINQNETSLDAMTEKRVQSIESAD